MSDSEKKEAKSFSEEAEQGQLGFFAEFWYFLCNNKKWWLTPILLVLLAVCALVIAGGSGGAPFIYTLF